MLTSLQPLPRVVLIALVTVVAPGCSEDRSYPAYRENPAPTDALAIVIRVQDAPVDVPAPKVFVSYEIDPLCLPPIDNYEGVQYAPQRQSVVFPVQRVSKTEFAATVFKDGMEVADYYGRGPCNWTPRFVQASFTLDVEGRPIRVDIPAFFPEIEDKARSTTYVEKTLRPLTPGQTPERASIWTDSQFQKIPQGERSKYFPIEISRKAEGEIR
ncbi:hypothetical protein [Stenotrophomonas sp. YAU14D1_LEIMI4_1]|uniref:hypothetical protein n=1 Tax=Stenotrophomonas sp. YAU14D1_LEIMI4_1 TaxID=2072407 RepID=UPI000D53EC71|nr:hypothetical protein [Stenotrophomonas sp. YAU14D1_LEIMI4_1]AWH25717.1 hypothetical protein C1932_11770 [Stenotrophomonas sp. YAU14D1_LEIMI4_1]